MSRKDWLSISRAVDAGLRAHNAIYRSFVFIDGKWVDVSTSPDLKGGECEPRHITTLPPGYLDIHERKRQPDEDITRFTPFAPFWPLACFMDGEAVAL